MYQAAARTRHPGHPSSKGLLAGLLILIAIPMAGATDLRVAVISDLNGAYGSADYEPDVRAAVARIIGLKPDLVLSTGDMIAGQRRPHLPRPQIERMWQSFHTLVSGPLAAANIPLAVTPGNHDGSAYRGFESERAIYAEQWNARRPVLEFIDQTGYPFHYAFTSGDTLFVSLDATTTGHLPAEQTAWLEDLLEQHGPSFRRRVVFTHLPLWPFAQGREREYIGDPALQRILEDTEVDLFVSGHHHAFYPGSKGGVVHLGQSCLGAGPRRLLGAADASPRAFSLIEFGDAATRITAYVGPSFATVIDWHALPSRLHSAATELMRADLAGAAQPGPAAEAAAVPGISATLKAKAPDAVNRSEAP